MLIAKLSDESPVGSLTILISTLTGEVRLGGGRSKWVEPLLPADFFPPIDLRWPEYISTPRGEEWWLPTPNPTARQLIE